MISIVKIAFSKSAPMSSHVNVVQLLKIIN